MGTLELWRFILRKSYSRSKRTRQILQARVRVWQRVTGATSGLGFRIELCCLETYKFRIRCTGGNVRKQMGLAFSSLRHIIFLYKWCAATFQSMFLLTQLAECLYVTDSKVLLNFKIVVALWLLSTNRFLKCTAKQHSLASAHCKQIQCFFASLCCFSLCVATIKARHTHRKTKHKVCIYCSKIRKQTHCARTFNPCLAWLKWLQGLNAAL